MALFDNLLNLQTMPFKINRFTEIDCAFLVQGRNFYESNNGNKVSF